MQQQRSLPFLATPLLVFQEIVSSCSDSCVVAEYREHGDALSRRCRGLWQTKYVTVP